MISEELSIGDLADAAGLSRRAVRFYVQQGLLQPPLGRGRGRHYDRSHLDRLRRIGELQQAGHSLEAIRRILEGGKAEPIPAPDRRPRSRAAVSSGLWTRVSLADGVELHVDASCHELSVEQLLAIRCRSRPTRRRWTRLASEPAKRGGRRVRVGAPGNTTCSVSITTRRRPLWKPSRFARRTPTTALPSAACASVRGSPG
jgi:DNA-binding transcriptional MerR regulator